MRAGVVSSFIAISLLLCLPQGASAIPLQNGDLSSFSGWSGSIYDGSSTIVDPATDSHFSLVAGGAELGNDFSFWEVALFQEFDLDSNATNISFDYEWSVTDSSQDFFQAILIDGAFNLIDLFPIGTDFSLNSNSGTAVTDVSSLAGQTVTIEFLLLDGDFDEGDIFTVGNIQIETASVPEPSTLLLLGIGILGLLLGVRKHQL